MNKPITCELCGRIIDCANDCDSHRAVALCPYCWEGLFSVTRNPPKPQRRRPRRTPRSLTNWDDDDPTTGRT